MFSKLFLLALPLVLAAPAVKRTEGDITFYTPGQGACAGTHGVEDMVAAVGANLYDTQDVCGKTITLQGDAGTVTLTVVEEVSHTRCEACKDTDLDVSPAAFEQAIGPKNIGRGKGTWNFV
ncbi:related to rasp f 7 allergen [Fusarium fujikuroi IMI 58289]|uniref:Related to rasp f 7 allergen n=1 Tax=Gibberella fujikuroi (strain CBS 195.34 / IMI 58289 / NRRL A-6831) TaxID=1279085 RepID=S0EF24_GIBF5|nr:related to rasp f 7 allergen [Fusarium fujikuroi IMI 58289]CCT73374.1 related to rasp f 7 allergen [Fusarium fujikuroi IMI 58289]